MMGQRPSVEGSVLRWDQLPVWDATARGRIEFEARGRTTIKLLADQVSEAVLSSVSV